MSQDFNDYIIDILKPWASISMRKMFGGYGVYRSGIMFGLIDDSNFYLKVDESNIADFKAINSEPFTYQSKNKRVTLSYWLVVAELFEDEERLAVWAEKSYAAAFRAKNKK